MANRVTFGAPTAISHKPNPPATPPDHYAGLVNPAETLKIEGGVSWTWNETFKAWSHPAFPMDRIYFDDGTYQVRQGATVVESGTWSAVA